MKIGDEIILKGKIVDFDSNPHGSAIKVEIATFVDEEELASLLQDRADQKRGRLGKQMMKIWIHRLDQKNVIVG